MPLTVEQLIRRLQAFPQNAKVKIEVDNDVAKILKPAEHVHQAGPGEVVIS